MVGNIGCSDQWLRGENTSSRATVIKFVDGFALDKTRTLPAIRPSAAIRTEYDRRLMAEIDAMQSDVAKALERTYRRNEPEIAQDASPARTLQAEMRRLGRKWLRRFDKLAPELAAYFATATEKRVSSALMAALKRAGFTVKFQITRAQNDVIQATIAENVSLIKSIPAQYLTGVEGLVMRSVTAGRDLQVLSEGLQTRYGVTKRRSALISLDQNNKATAALTRARHLELGIEEAIWLHSAGGKTKRRSHVANSGNRYNIREGWYDPDAKERIWPGTLVGCRCVPKAVIPGF